MQFMQVLPNNNVTVQKNQSRAGSTLLAQNNSKNIHKSNNNIQIINLQI